jgi:hypothetical protein
MKCHYLPAQIAKIIMQLYENGVKSIRAAKWEIKMISSLLSESIRTRSLTDGDIADIGRPIQIRFAGLRYTGKAVMPEDVPTQFF